MSVVFPGSGHGGRRPCSCLLRTRVKGSCLENGRFLQLNESLFRPILNQRPVKQRGIARMDQQTKIIDSKDFELRRLTNQPIVAEAHPLCALLISRESAGKLKAVEAAAAATGFAVLREASRIIILPKAPAAGE